MTDLDPRTSRAASRPHRPRLLASLVWFVASCTGAAADPGDDASAMTSDEATEGESAGDASTGDDETASCEAACAFETACMPEYPFASCVADCLFNLGVYDGDEACDDAMALRYACEAEYEGCEPAQVPDACAAALASLQDCELKYGCALDFGLSSDGSTCMATETCNLLDPHVRAMSCDETTCVCTEAGQVTGQCDAQGLCPSIQPFDPDVQTLVVEFVAACCGWTGFGEPQAPGGG